MFSHTLDEGVTDSIDTYKQDVIFTESGERLRLGKLQPALREFLVCTSTKPQTSTLVL